MGIAIEVISKEMIKPSTPTPHHLHHYQFSSLDRKSPANYIPLIYFFKNDEKLGSNDISEVLKLSLSKQLSRYYPLAGCVKDDYVDCNDDGALFLEAKVSCQLSQIIQEPVIPSELHKYLPHLHKDDTNDIMNDLALAIQANFFNCGSVAICVHMSHKIADASSLITFVKNWATTARGDGDNKCQQFLGVTLFPPKDITGSVPNVCVVEKNIVSKRFVFSGSRIAALREKYANTASGLDKGIYPTRVEALSTFLWSRFASSTQIISRPDPKKCCLLVYPVNLRKRIDKPLPDDSFGNFLCAALTFFSHDNAGEECYFSGLVKSLRDCISKIKKDYVKKMQNDHNELIKLSNMVDEGRINEKDIVLFGFTSLCRYPVYDADFGWGRPLWVAWGGFPYKNVAVLMDTKYGDGIEAWIHLNQEHMAKFETDEELLAYASPTPST